MALYLIHYAVEGKVEGLLKRLALMFYKEGMARNVHLDFRHLVFDGMGYIVEDEVYFHIHNFVVESAEFVHLGVNALRKPCVGIEVHRLNLYVHEDADLVKK